MNYTVYLSSTKNDLEDERSAVFDALKSKCVVKQSYSASESALIDSCIDDVAQCDLYIGIVGLRYGHIPNNAVRNPQNLSITELEYEEAGRKRIPRLVFLKDVAKIFAPGMDAHTREHEPERVEGFRKRAGGGDDQRPALFKDVGELKLHIVEAFNDFKARREREPTLFGKTSKHAAELVTDVTVSCVRGTDDAQKAAIQATGDKRFLARDLSPDDPAFLLSLDGHLRTARVGCLLISQASLGRLLSKPDLVPLAIDAIRERCGTAFLVLDGLAMSDLPAAWHAAERSLVVPFGAGEFLGRTQECLSALYASVREHCLSIADDRRVGIPYVVLSLTEPQALALADDAGPVLAAYDNTTRSLRAEQLQLVMNHLKAYRADWPKGCYGAHPEDWRPIGPTGPTAEQLIAGTVERINAEQPGSRARRLLGDFRLQARRHSFEGFVNDRLGSRALLEDIRDRGCLVLVDEFALLHPDIRRHADMFLSGQSTAVMCASPCDPGYQSTAELLGELSHVKVGVLLQRFRDLRDPRCELALNSQPRLERWLHFVLPEVAAMLGQVEGRPELVNNVGDILKPTRAPGP